VTDSGEWHGQVSDRCGENTRNREHKTDRKNTHMPGEYRPAWIDHLLWLIDQSAD